MRKLLTIAFAFSAAIFSAQYVVPFGWLLPCAGIFAALSLCALFFRDTVRLRIFVICLSFAAGLLWNYGYRMIYYSPAERLDGETLTVSAVVADFPAETDYGAKVTVNLIPEQGPRIKTTLYVRDIVPNLLPGDTIEVTAKLALTSTMYGEETDIFTSKGIFLSAYASGDITATGSAGKFKYFPQYITKALKDQVSSLFPSDTVAFMRALITGDQGLVNADARISNAFSVTGVSHIVSVSGMHVAFLLGFMGLVIKKKRLLFFVGVPIIFLIMAMTGFTPPVVRSGIMQIFILAAAFTKRENDNITAFSASLMIILAFNPFSAANIGLQLSFAATLGMILFSGKINGALSGLFSNHKAYSNKFLKAALHFIIAGLSTTFAALAFTIPLTAYYFGHISLIAPIANLLVVWAVSFAFCGGFIACLLGFVFAPIGAAAAFIVALLIRYIINISVLLARVPLASVHTTNPYITLWLLSVYIIMIAFFYFRIKLRKLTYPICAAVISLCIILVANTFYFSGGSLTITALNVGQGQSLVITSGSNTAVVDCGGGGMLNNAGSIAADYIAGRGISKIDILILTHFHADHANGVETLIESVNISALIIPDPEISESYLAEDIIDLARRRNIDIIYVTENLLVEFGQAEISLYAPIGGTGENERGLTILFSENDFDILITGDMNSTLERRLIAANRFPDIEVLMVGHHGSKYSTSIELLAAVTPEAAIISVGHNSYGHPTQEALDRLADFGITVYRTDELGHVTIRN